MVVIGETIVDCEPGRDQWSQLSGRGEQARRAGPRCFRARWAEKRSQDANWNTTAVVGYDATSGTWNMVQRYVYSPYGNIIILNPNFTTAPAGTVPMVNNLYQGMALDPVTGLYYERARWYSPSLGTWTSQDPLQYINGANTYQFVGSDPVGMIDILGLCLCDQLQQEYRLMLSIQDSVRSDIRAMSESIAMELSLHIAGVSPARIVHQREILAQDYSRLNIANTDLSGLYGQLRANHCTLGITTTSTYTGQYAVDQMSAVQDDSASGLASVQFWFGAFVSGNTVVNLPKYTPPTPVVSTPNAQNQATATLDGAFQVVAAGSGSYATISLYGDGGLLGSDTLLAQLLYNDVTPVGVSDYWVGLAIPYTFTVTLNYDGINLSTNLGSIPASEGMYQALSQPILGTLDSADGYIP